MSSLRKNEGKQKVLLAIWLAAGMLALWFVAVVGGQQPDILWRVRAHESPMWGHPIELSRDGRYLVSGAAGGTPNAGNDNSVKIWNVNNGQLVRLLSGNRGPAHAISISPDNRIVVAGSNWFHGQISVWDAQNGSLLYELPGHTYDTWDTQFSPDGSLLASVGGWADPTVKIWRVSNSSWSLIATLTAPSSGGDLFCVDWSS